MSSLEHAYRASLDRHCRAFDLSLAALEGTKRRKLTDGYFSGEPTSLGIPECAAAAVAAADKYMGTEIGIDWDDAIVMEEKGCCVGKAIGANYDVDLASLSCSEDGKIARVGRKIVDLVDDDADEVPDDKVVDEDIAGVAASQDSISEEDGDDDLDEEESEYEEEEDDEEEEKEQDEETLAKAREAIDRWTSAQIQMDMLLHISGGFKRQLDRAMETIRGMSRALHRMQSPSRNPDALGERPMRPESQDRFRCPACQKLFRRYKWFRRHILKKHQAEVQMILGAPSSRPADDDDDDVEVVAAPETSDDPLDDRLEEELRQGITRYVEQEERDDERARFVEFVVSICPNGIETLPDGLCDLVFDAFDLPTLQRLAEFCGVVVVPFANRSI